MTSALVSTTINNVRFKSQIRLKPRPHKSRSRANNGNKHLMEVFLNFADID